MTILWILAALDLATIAGMADHRLPLSIGATIHAACTVAALRHALRSRAPIASVAAAALGPAAMLPALALARLLGPVRRRAIRIERAPGPTRGEAADRRITDRIADDRLRSPDAGQLLRFADILRSGDIQARQQVITTVVRNFDPRLSSLIVTALTDADQSIRTQAAAAVAEIEQALVRKRAALSGRPGRGAAWGLSGILLDHATHNLLLSDANRAGLRTAALDILDRLAVSVRPGDPEGPALARRRATALLALHRAPEAAALLDPLIDPVQADPVSLALLVDALVAARRYDRLAAVAARMADRREPPDDALGRRIAFWHAPVAA